MLLIWPFRRNEERNIAVEILHSLDKKIPLITLNEDNQNFEREKRKLYSELDTAPIKEIIAAADELDSKVERYIRIQQDENCKSIIEHHARKNTASASEIVEICDPLDREIVCKYVQVRIKEGFGEILKNIRDKLASAEHIIERVQSAVSEKDDADELRKYWNYILIEEQDILKDLKNRVDRLKSSEFDTFMNDISDLIDRFGCLEKYGREYLNEQALEVQAKKVREYMPREDIPDEDFIYGGLSDSIVAELKDCTGRDNEGEIIKRSIAKIIYGRLKKGMFLR